jgi:hypothetical protein
MPNPGLAAPLHGANHSPTGQVITALAGVFLVVGMLVALAIILL